MLLVAGIAGWAAEAAAQTADQKAAPASDTATAASVARPAYNKGRSPGSRNAYAARYDEDFAYLHDPDKATSPLDALKFIRLNQSGSAYLTLNGEARYRFDYTENRNFGAAPSATVAAQAGTPLRLGAVRPPLDSELSKQRYTFGADLHLGEHFRLYADLWHAEQTGHGAGTVIPASQRNDLEMLNGFGELTQSFGDVRTGVRVGRQMLFFGNVHNVGANLATSLPDPVFDGVRAYADWGHTRIDAFGYNAYKFKDGVFAGDDNPHRNLWGIYASTDLPATPLFGETLSTTLDAFYYGFRAAPDNNGPGTGLYNVAALRTAATVSATAGFRVAQDRRHTVGVRWYGEVGPVSFDWDAAVQRGSYGSLDVRAWAFNTDTGYTFAALPWRPRLGVHIDAASGGGGGSELRTYQPMFPDTLYYLPNSFFSPTNFYDIAPRIRVTPMPGLTAEAYYAFLWRQSEEDAVYTGNWKGANGTNALAASAMVRGRAIGSMPSLTVSWVPLRHVILRATVAEFLPGSALKAIQARNTTYVNTQLTVRF